MKLYFQTMRLLFLLFGLTSMGLSAQVNLDSLWGVWNDPQQSDTNKLDAIAVTAWYGYLFTQPDSAFYFAQLQYDLAEKGKNKEHMGWALFTQGASHYLRDNYSEAIEHYMRSLKIREQLTNQSDIAVTLNNIGLVYKSKGDYTNAIDYYSRSLEIINSICVVTF